MPRPLALLAALALGAALPPAPAQPAKKVTLQAATEVSVESPRPLRSLLFSPDGKTLAVGAEDVHLFDVTPKAVTPAATIKAGDPEAKTSVRAMAFTPDGKYLLFAAWDNSVKVWSLAEKKEVGAGKVHQGRVQAAAVAADGRLVATGSADKSVVLWNLSADGRITENAVLRAELKADQAVRGLAFTSKGGLVVAAGGGLFRSFTLGKDGPKLTGGFQPAKGVPGGGGHVVANPAATLWAVPGGSSVYLVTTAGMGTGTLGGPAGHQGAVQDAAFSPDGKLLATGGQDGNVIVWDVAAKAAKFSKGRPGEFNAVAFSPKEDANGDFTLAAGLNGGIVHVLKLGYR
jgi:WD40 repeat protein